MGGFQSNMTNRKGSRIPSRKALLLLSGGLDSTVLLALTNAQGYNVRTLFFDYGQPTVELEDQFAKKNSARYGATGHTKLVINADILKSRGSFYPGRNLLLLSAAAAFAESEGFPTIFIGLVTVVHSPFFTPEYPDVTPEFLSRVNQTLELGAGMRITVQAPLINVQKPGIFSLAKALGVDPDETISCHFSRGCGECIACIERAYAQQV